MLVWWTFVWFIGTRLKKIYIKGMDINNIVANTRTRRQHAAHTTNQLSSPNCLIGAIQKSLSLNEKYWRIFWGKGQENGTVGRKKDKTERAMGVGRRTREEIVKWNQMTALRVQTGGRYQKSPASLRGALSTGNTTKFHSILTFHALIYNWK